MLKRDEKKECCLDCSKKEFLNEFIFQATAVIERIAMDANLLVYDLAADVNESVVRHVFNNRIYKSICYSVQCFPKLAAAMQMFVIVR